MTQLFVIISRDINEEVNYAVCEDFDDACAMQLGMLVGVSLEDAKPHLREEDTKIIKNNLEKYGQDRLANDEIEVFIFFITGKEKMR